MHVEVSKSRYRPSSSELLDTRARPLLNFSLRASRLAKSSLAHFRPSTPSPAPPHTRRLIETRASECVSLSETTRTGVVDTPHTWVR